jgi:hypothetical protein
MITIPVQPEAISFRYYYYYYSFRPSPPCATSWFSSSFFSPSIFHTFLFHSRFQIFRFIFVTETIMLTQCYAIPFYYPVDSQCGCGSWNLCGSSPPSDDNDDDDDDDDR